MIGSPQNNFITMQNPQPRNQMLGNALRNSPDTQDRSQPSMLAPNQYGSPTPQMSNWQMPQSNAGYNLQPNIPNDQCMPQGPIGMNQQGVNRFGVGLARPQQTQVS